MTTTTLPDGSVAVTTTEYGLLEVTDTFGAKGRVVEGWTTTSREYAEREVAKSGGRWVVTSREVTVTTSQWTEVES